MKKILECSTKGDKRYSAFYARVKVYGIEDSIERHYQSCKRDSKGNEVGKGKRVDYMVLHNKNTNKKYKLSPKYLTAYYKLLWCKYLDNHPELVLYAREYDDYSDMFKGKYTINCQADVIRDYVKKGRDSIIKDKEVKEFIKLLRE